MGGWAGVTCFGVCLCMGDKLTHSWKSKSVGMQYYTCVSLCTQLCKSRPGNDRYSDRGMQTINDAPKPKLIQTEQVIKMVSHTLSMEVVSYSMQHITSNINTVIL